MTLQHYAPERMDQLALRVLDLAAIVRDIAHKAEEAGVKSFALNDKKPLEWLENLELWVHDARAKVETELIRQRGARRAAGSRKK